MNASIRLVSVFTLFALFAGIACAAETSENNALLKRGLELYPEADANKDGILTEAEANAFRTRLRRDPANAGGPKPMPRTTNLRYGPHDRNVLDLWVADGEGPRPLAVFIHGGGWLGGDKGSVSGSHIERFLEAGISVASINYRFSTIEPFPTPLRDGGLAVQFLRHHADKYNIDPKRVACYGTSAGAVTSLWLAFHEDFADAGAADPVLRQSTRLICAGSIVGPTTLDKATMDEWFGMKVVTHHAMYPLFGVNKGDEQAQYSPKIRKIAAEASPIHHLSPDDPPVFLDFPQNLEPLPTRHNASEMIHHPLFGVKLKEAMDRIGVEAIFQAGNVPQDRYEDIVDFLIQKLTAAP